MENKDLDEKFAKTELTKVKNVLALEERESRIKEERVEALQKKIEEMQRNLSGIAEVLAMKATIAEVQRALARKREGQR